MPAVSGAQFSAMAAACAGKSKTGIPRKVGCEFARHGKPKSLPHKLHRSDHDSGHGKHR